MYLVVAVIGCWLLVAIMSNVAVQLIVATLLVDTILLIADDNL